MSTTKKIKPLEPAHTIAFHAIVELLRRHSESVSAPDMLALGANLVGKMMAAQDPAIMTPQQALDIVSVNIEQGNHEAIMAMMMETSAGRA
jgi:hypothetical protein